MSRRLVKLSVICLLMVHFNSNANTLEPFTTDGCSSFPDGTLKQKNLFLPCCTQHDFAYWQGGTAEQRAEADDVFSACITQVSEPYLAKLMLLGVRVGGVPYLPTPFRWGYGWPYPKSYGKLSAAEQAQVDKLTPPAFKNE